MSTSAHPRTVILVHGAWADGSCWANVILPLRRQGLGVMAAPLPLTSLSDDAAALRRVIERTRGPLTLVAHAYAGAVIAAVHDDRVRSLVYIAALAPDEGETVAEVFYRAEPHPLAPQLQPDAHGLIWMPEGGFERAAAHRATADQLSVMSAIQRPIALRCIQEKAPAPAWKTTPTRYLIADEDRMIHPETQRFMARRMGASAHSHSVDHTPMYHAPEIVVETILSAARENTAE
ncbi:MAG TPA: alpha/beta hydrolase [Acidobacteriaceae bacterium]|nr:alpha/beta hydrolase [Acidobacteriaceae bacterium]